MERIYTISKDRHGDDQVPAFPSLTMYHQVPWRVVPILITSC
jgi:hypothetical protein